ncbi:two pore domain potassium channel family protein [Wenzhouxiangella sp. XN79A]|uniref:potassium channel family protein n=1 Tax=Wenzhouxiangella sp. XN79A TaxID=2724193 RepID=UPI00144ABE65|nr:potassium channel family protein [Wenzhouxiangella sp. XN79A]NKI34749.1 two pore domain potassium channel family protein [Wenzhouxiangella sp. XN79A]
MEFTFSFLWNLARVLWLLAPLFLGLGAIIAGLSAWVGRREGWSIGDSLYFGFITALTVGYGDLRPTTGRNKFLAIVIALFGLITSGILVATAVEVVSMSFRSRAH